MCLGNIFKDFSSSNATGLCEYVYDFSVDYKAITNNKIHDIHPYLKKTILYKIVRVIKKILTITFLVSGVHSLKCVLIKNQECKVREVIVNNEYMVYPFSIKINKCSGNCNNIKNPYSVCAFQMLLKILLQKYLI